MATILYAEDDDAMRKFFEKALEKAITGFAAVAMSDEKASETTVLSKPVHLRQLVTEVDRLIAA